ncbi:MAG: bifunctional (p)ppGpp synthetase/guanosine-3',5'-bis(diphosphate) 3'-pyrophosphohydrolase [Chloroflexi bacterium]|nr:MAG: bifunctional (p)ppGpp synthetase/guanosine-3',5'-bis(diphosphate) 3'-pyrophosphohydrolase [Chloroflexota bacterium]MBL1193718.1 bifunctional (p)ppGpp synthetase/guanosine-3',5'-bis(diphosphate) 3'-pyrophosphohydrolase [Chloroflexota bacterium]NOH11011.1 bifunctional (p)ppGpp synthetase/guanosine-3',5'-bis(diphosphate) 3'-pyrophosphohydrolase [Chloroflexota bacterium]
MQFETFFENLPQRYSPVDRDLVQRAYRVAAEAHKGQKRVSGEPYVSHCVAVSSILAELHVPPEIIAAGLLHDTVEDTDVTLEDLERDFGAEIAKLVDGVTKLDHLPRVSRIGKHSTNGASEEDDEDFDDAPAALGRARRPDLASETLRKTFLAMSEDVRVVLIKLADRLHNMRTLGHMPDHKRQRIARQTLDIFAPLASRLGIWQLKWELEDLGFRYVDPETYKDVADNLAERRSEREKQLTTIIKQLGGLLKSNEIEAEITGRPKHIYSIYNKMRRKDVPFEMVRDVRAIRILVKDIPACYSVLGLIHTHWRPIPGEFDDYIAAPKDNFYQSLHTAVLFDDGKTLEVQIRTQEMHQNAEYGIAAHWRYKEGGPRDEDYERRVVWLRQLMEWMQEVEDASEFVDSMKTDVFSDRVYAFTPRGDIIDLPMGATSIDFAYHVHTDVGHRCRGAKVNGKLVSLDTVLKTGDQVEILTAKRGGPSRDWLNPNLGLVKSQRARSKVRYWFKQQDREQNISQGKAMLEREMRRLSLSEADLDEVADDFGFRDLDNMYLAIGYGDLGVGRVVNLMNTVEVHGNGLPFQLDEVPQRVTVGHDAISVLGLQGLLTTMAKCCKPAPGDEIIGYVTRGRGATIHRRDCPNVLRVKDTERLVRVSWGEASNTFPVAVIIRAYDRDGLLRDVSTVIAEEGINMSQVKVDVNQNQAIFDLILNVGDIEQLSRVLTKVEKLPNVMEARRVKPG